MAARGRHGFAVALVAVCVAAASVGAPPASLGRPACDWVADVLPLPHNMDGGRVTAGDGAWLAGSTGAGDGVLWHDGRLVVLGRAFGLDTRLAAVNPEGVAVGSVTGPDGRPRAVRYRRGFEYLPNGTAALDVNPDGEIVGYDGPTLVVWSVDGEQRRLPMPTGAQPFGDPSIDDDGTVVARTGRLATDGTVRWRLHAWTPDGTRRPLPASDNVIVADARRGRVVGLANHDAVVWARGERTVLPRGARVAAVNPHGTVVGAGPDEQNLVWPSGRLPRPLPPPRHHHRGRVTAINDHEAGGYALSLSGGESVPVRWRCHSVT